jgi:hypothetical protein
MNGTSVLFGQMLAVFGIVVAGTWAATQWTAAHLGASPPSRWTAFIYKFLFINRESLLRHLLLTWFLFGCEAARPNAAPRPIEGKHHADSLPPLRLYPSTQQRDHAAAAVSAASRISSMDWRRQHGGSSGHRTCPKRAAGSAACCYQHFAHDTARSTGQPSGRHSPSAQKRQIDSA